MIEDKKPNTLKKLSSFIGPVPCIIKYNQAQVCHPSVFVSINKATSFILTKLEGKQFNKMITKIVTNAESCDYNASIGLRVKSDFS